MVEIDFTQGNILQANTEAFVNPVNCVGIMGRGLALQFRKAFPENFQAYKKACNARQVKPGKMWVFELDRIEKPRFIINFPTKRHWRSKSCIEDIEAGLEDLVEVILQQEIRSIAIPALGCGLGGLDWLEVRSLILNAVRSLSQIQVLIFEPVVASKS